MMKEPDSRVRADAGRWSCPDPESMESEVADFIVAMVRMMKPECVVEIGSYTGILAREIGEALRDEERGHLHTLEINPSRAHQAMYRCTSLPVTVHNLDANESNPHAFGLIDLLIVDGNRMTRAADYVRWSESLAEFGVAAIHDTLKYDPPLSEVRQLEGDQVWFRTPRGLTLLQPNDRRRLL